VGLRKDETMGRQTDILENIVGLYSDNLTVSKDGGTVIFSCPNCHCPLPDPEHGKPFTCKHCRMTYVRYGNAIELPEEHEKEMLKLHDEWMKSNSATPKSNDALQKANDELKKSDDALKMFALSLIMIIVLATITGLLFGDPVTGGVIGLVFWIFTSIALLISA